MLKSARVEAQGLPDDQRRCFIFFLFPRTHMEAQGLPDDHQEALVLFAPLLFLLFNSRAHIMQLPIPLPPFCLSPSSPFFPFFFFFFTHTHYDM
jgi:hypothetical protein